MSESVKLQHPCPMHPEQGRHEAMPDEACCAYCGERIIATCNGCGRFLKLAEIHGNECRCDGCM